MRVLSLGDSIWRASEANMPFLYFDPGVLC